ncbi:hypothetical protein [Kaistia sp. MMO-174]|uniref:hypothetical protein n=1 Tax=Kaistia sp. MMO-174 TaxID=3081256 RepID=UPI003017F411
MVGRPGKTQASFTAGEVDPGIEANYDLKYRAKGLKTARNIEPIPQGGYFGFDGLRDIGAVDAASEKIFTFTASNGVSYDLVAGAGKLEVWGETSKLATVTVPYTAEQLSTADFVQQLDTAFIFHPDVQPRRLKHLGPTNWQVDLVPFLKIPSYDYGAVYTNGVAAQWDIQFTGLNTDSVFVLTISGNETSSIEYQSTLADMIPDILAAINDLPVVKTGIAITYVASGRRGRGTLRITFSGTGNEGDGWAVSGRVTNKADAAVLSYKQRPGVKPGEDLISDTRGWPRCGAIYQQRLLMGGFRSLPNAWICSISGEYFNFDDRLDEANGSFLVPMDTPGGEVIERIAAQRNLLIFTNRAEYWVQDRALDKTKPPVHVQASEDGVRPGVPVCQNEGAALFAYRSGSVIGEFRYTDVDGNFVATAISILSAHLISDVVDMAIRRPNAISDGSLLAVVLGDGRMRAAKLLRAQDVTAFFRIETLGTFKAVACNDRNELSVLVDVESASGTSRRLQRFDASTFLHSAKAFSFGSPTNVISGLSLHEGREVWVVGDDNVFGPFVVAGGSVTLPVPVSAGEVGRWIPPVAELLPPTREVGPNIVIRRKARIHSAQVTVRDTTSIAIAANGGRARDVPLRRYGDQDNVPSLQAPYDGVLTVRGLSGYQNEPTLTITQTRPGFLHVDAITQEAKL